MPFDFQCFSFSTQFNPKYEKFTPLTSTQTTDVVQLLLKIYWITEVAELHTTGLNHHDSYFNFDN